MITQESIDKIFETARIEEVIGDFITLKKSGSNYKGLSPFSNERTPSFMVSPAKQIFKDFSSGKGGNVVSFLMEHEHYTYPEALKFLAKRYNIEIEETGQTDEEKQKRSVRESLFLVNEFANRYFIDQLWKSEEGKNIGLSYFKERGFTDEIIEAFQLGYSPEEWEALANAAKKDNYQLEFLTQAGLIIEKSGRYFDRFRGRVMFPILSHTGRVLGFGGRTLKKDLKAAKYLNSPESEIYHKSKTLYGIFQAKNELSKQDNCLLVEGYTDVISLHQAGVKNVVASSGTALTKDQINLIKRYTQNITILYDGDPAGIKASLRGIDLVLEEGMNVRVLLFPEGEDPDSYSRKVSSAELKSYIDEEKRDFLRFKAGLLLKEAGENPLERSKAAREMVESIARIPDTLERNAYVQECASILKMEERVLFAELAQIRSNLVNKEEKERKREEQKQARLQVVEKDEKQQETPAGQSPTTELGRTAHYEQEKAIIWLLLNHPDKRYNFDEPEPEEDEEIPDETVAEYILMELEEDELRFQNPVFAKIHEALLKQYNETGQVHDAGFFIRAEDKAVVETVADLVTQKYHLHDWGKRKVFLPEEDYFVRNYTIQAVLRYREKRIGDLIKGIQDKVKAGQVTGDEMFKKLESLSRLNGLRIEINQVLNRVL